MNKLIKLLADNRSSRGRRFGASAKAAAQAGAKEAEILLYDVIVSSPAEAEWWGGVDAQSFVKAVRDLDVDLIHLRIDSPGGSVFAAQAMSTALREHKARVVVHVDGLAASAASKLAMAGDEVLMAPGSMMMIHKAWTVAYGNSSDLQATAALLDKIDGELAAEYANRSGQTTDQISQWMDEETWFTAQEAVDAGLADSVKSFDPKASAAAPTAAACGAQWNLSAYEKAPQSSAQATPQPEVQTSASGELTMTVQIDAQQAMSEIQSLIAELKASLPEKPIPTVSEALASDDHRARQQQRLSALARIG